MQVIKFFTSILAVASVAIAAPVAPYKNQTKSALSTTEDTSSSIITASATASAAINNDDAAFEFFGISAPIPLLNITNLHMEAAAETKEDNSLEQHNANRLHMAVAATLEEGRPGKIPYRRFPQCYIDCFDSEGIDSKTWPAIGDIRDLTTHEFCYSQHMWVANWFLEHLQFCVGACVMGLTP
ncbi:hypothetical protein PFICI_12782 [Pestalotiopsis fici W106-1]|uniref:Uncharacterized protein n=1 Tax=Pestalotiopsis fici (strain W106-1 / CGMCC3.15140) TaxID=1229662 RepID=W3WPQ3_PESFW|nr:uncharacterized protein PFICI_12782 [Pestalotiopsis fici W106-1]ETS75838.1 hypothetical protein PFICI_12782 [Pestalotiopsis fici W106-1]